jgi:rhodanese-related sulfurtransferase
MSDETGRVIDPIAPLAAKALLDRGDAVLVDVREPQELAATGKAAGAVHVPRGLIEARADPGGPERDARLDPEKTVILYCGSGKRAELAGRTLLDLGYARVFNLGGLKDWLDAGLPLET